jgi:hypothetical protein
MHVLKVVDCIVSNAEVLDLVSSTRPKAPNHKTLLHSLTEYLKSTPASAPSALDQAAKLAAIPGLEPGAKLTTVEICMLLNLRYHL